MHHFLRALAAVLLLGTASLSACSKDAAAPTAAPTPEQLLVGRWQLVSSTNGMTGGSSPADPAQRFELVFTSAGHCTALLNGAVVKTGPYSLTKRVSMLTKQPAIYLLTDPGTLQVPQTVRVDAAALVLSIDAYDGPSGTYQRQL